MEDYVTFEQAEALKKLGFDWSCETFWDDEGSPQVHEWVIKNYHDYPFVDNEEDCTVLRPTLAHAQKWLREKHKIIILVDTYFKNYMDGDYSKAEFEYVIVYMNFNAARKGSSKDGKLFESYEKALSAGINVALKFIK